jgi:hypothetical protein
MTLLAAAKDPPSVQFLVRKLFDGAARLEFEGLGPDAAGVDHVSAAGYEILRLISLEGESLTLVKAVKARGALESVSLHPTCSR